MSRRTHHKTTYVIHTFFKSENVKTTIALLMIELALLFLTVYKGLGRNYLPVTVMLMIFTVFGCAVAFYWNADRYLLIIVLILLNLGFVVQEIGSGNGVVLEKFLVKFAAAGVTTFIVAFSYRFFAGLLVKDKIVIALMLFQILLGIGIAVLGSVIGSSEEQKAVISIGGVTPFEVVKTVYLFVVAGLLCKEEIDTIFIVRWNVQRENVLIFHTAFLSVFFLICKELGTLMVIYLTGLLMLWIFGKNRRLVWVLTSFTVFGFLLLWIACDQFLYPMLAENRIILPGIFSKLVKRFGVALHPERAMSGAGYQGTLGLEALSIGGLLGISTERHRLALPEAANDFVFANVIQTCGFLMGMVIVLSFFALLKRGMEIASECKDIYFQGTATAITIMITAETVIHIAYNIAMFPITGIPLYFVSQGFTAIVTGMALSTVLLVISDGRGLPSIKGK